MSTHVSRWDRSEPEIKRDLIREMNRLGVVRLEGNYSGGHDEGGLQDMQLFKPGGVPFQPEEALTWDDALWSAVDALLSTKFYTWALEGYVWGKVFVDLEEKRAWTEGQVEVMHHENDGDPIDWSW